MNEKYAKITQVIMVLAAFIAGYVSKVIFEFCATVFGFVARLYSIESVSHGLPITIGVILFLYLQFNSKIKNWIQSVILEVDKVVWPTKKDTLSMTVIVCFILVISGVVLGLFDLSAGAVLQYILN